MLGLKRKGSSLRHTHHKSLRTTVDSFVYRPRNEDYLGDIDECRLESLRTAMAVDTAQFNRLAEQLRRLANELLDVDLSWDEQDVDVRASFITEVHNQYPAIRSKFENGWPIVVYTRRYLTNKSRKSYRKRAHHASQNLTNFGLRHQRTRLNVQSYVAKPPNVDQLLDATERDIRRAMDFDGTQFRSIQSLLQNLAKKYLNVNAPYENQDRHQRRLLVQEASEAEPLFSTKYEGAWPIDIFLKRYLTQKVREASANLPSWTAGGQGPAPAPPGTLSVTQATSTNNCAYRYPPMLPYSQFTWSPANFTTNSSSRIRSPSVEFGDAGDDDMSSSPAPTLITSNNNHTSASNDKENTPPVHAPPSMSSDDPSAPVKKFLRSLNPNLERLLPRFCELGIEDLETLLAFKSWSSDERKELLGEHLNKLQLLAVQNFLRKSDQPASL